MYVFLKPPFLRKTMPAGQAILQDELKMLEQKISTLNTALWLLKSYERNKNKPRTVTGKISRKKIREMDEKNNR